MEVDVIFNEDCLEGMKKIPDGSIDLIVTDPPYNISDTNKRTKQGNEIKSNMEAWGEWDNYDKIEYDEMIVNVIKESFRVLKMGGVIYMFTAREDNGFFIRKATECGFTYCNQLAIIKTNPLPHFTKTNWRSCFELCFYMSKGKPKTFNFLSQKKITNTFNYMIGKKESEHPTEKPLNFFKLLIEVSSNESDIVLDCFLGSGTTAVACKELNRRYIGFETSKEYCEMAEKRLKQNTLHSLWN